MADSSTAWITDETARPCRELEAELAADKVLYRNTFGTQPAGGPLANAFNMHLKNPANTNAILWGGKLLALWEVGPDLYPCRFWSVVVLFTYATFTMHNDARQ